MARTESEPVETLRDFLEWASQFDDETYVFRGVPNEKYRIQASAYHQRGLAKAQLGQYENAIVDYDEAIQLNPNDASLYQQRALMKAQLERYEEAEEDRQKSEELDS